jgi:tungstate transport system substrate-binding protein
MERKLRKSIVLLVMLALFATLLVGCGSENTEVILATTTSTRDSGLLDLLIPVFEKESGYTVKTVAVGTGQALALGEKGEADVLLVHAPASEKPLVEKEVAVNRRLIMHNDFIIVGPKADPVGIKGTGDVITGFKLIYKKGSVFVSRGDDSGTHKKEKEIWAKVGEVVEPEAEDWYISVGSGMGDTLRIASEKEGYCLTDRATYLSLKDSLDLELIIEGDPSLLNIYHVMEINGKKFKTVNAKGGKAFADFLLSSETQKMIGEFGVEKYGQPLFVPDGGKTEEQLMQR